MAKTSPRTAPIVALACFVGASATSLQHGTAQRDTARRGGPLTRQVASSLAQLDLTPCAANPAWAARSVTAAVVVFPDRSLSVVLSPDIAGLAECIETALTSKLAMLRPGRAPRRPGMVSRTLELPETVELRAAATTRLSASAIASCVLRAAPRHLRRVEARVRIEVEGGALRRADLVSGSGPADRCMAVALRGPALPDGAAIVSVVAGRTTVAPGLARHDGTEGAVCQWGERDLHSIDPATIVPEPRACRAGLTCCYAGGVPGLPSTCRRVARNGCPRFP